eukprot:s2109_g12.t1
MSRLCLGNSPPFSEKPISCCDLVCQPNLSDMDFAKCCSAFSALSQFGCCFTVKVKLCPVGPDLIKKRSGETPSLCEESRLDQYLPRALPVAAGGDDGRLVSALHARTLEIFGVLDDSWLILGSLDLSFTPFQK